VAADRVSDAVEQAGDRQALADGEDPALVRPPPLHGLTDAKADEHRREPAADVLALRDEAALEQLLLVGRDLDLDRLLRLVVRLAVALLRIALLRIALLRIALLRIALLRIALL